MPGAQRRCEEQLRSRSVRRISENPADCALDEEKLPESRPPASSHTTPQVCWVPVDETPAMIARVDILGAITIIGVQHALLRRAAARVPPP